MTAAHWGDLDSSKAPSLPIRLYEQEGRQSLGGAVDHVSLSSPAFVLEALTLHSSISAAASS